LTITVAGFSAQAFLHPLQGNRLSFCVGNLLGMSILFAAAFYGGTAFFQCSGFD
jgi:hypothetical protein